MRKPSRNARGQFVKGGRKGASNPPKRRKAPKRRRALAKRRQAPAKRRTYRRAAPNPPMSPIVGILAAAVGSVALDEVIKRYLVPMTSPMVGAGIALAGKLGVGYYLQGTKNYGLAGESLMAIGAFQGASLGASLILPAPVPVVALPAPAAAAPVTPEAASLFYVGQESMYPGGNAEGGWSA